MSKQEKLSSQNRLLEISRKKKSESFSEKELNKFHMRGPALVQSFIDSLNKSIEQEAAS